MLEQISVLLASMLLVLSLKAILVVMLAVLMLQVFRTISVHAKHRIWTAVLVTLLLLPILGLSGLSWSVPVVIWPAAVPPSNSMAESGQPHSNGAGSNDSGLEGAEAHEATVFRTGPRNEMESDAISGRLRDDWSQKSPDSRPMSARHIEEERVGLASGSLSSSATEPQASFADSIHLSQRVQRPSLFVIGSMIWLAGVSVMLVRLLISIVRTVQIKWSSLAIEGQTFPAGVIIRESARIESPAVAGWWRPCILLPLCWRDWSPAKREAVFSHEMSHLRRRDTQISLLVEVMTLLYWFHPVSWLTKRKLSQLAELACDEAAAVAFGNRIEYAKYLVEIALANRQGARFQPGTAMARSSEIGQRVRALLDLSRPLTDRISWGSLAVIFLLGMPVAMLLAAVQPTAAGSQVPDTESRPAVSPDENVSAGSDDKPTIVPAKSTPVVTAKTPSSVEGPILILRGTLFMPDGSVAKNAILERSPSDQSDVLSVSSSKGQFEIKTTGTLLNSSSILCRTPDGNFQTRLPTTTFTLREKCLVPQRITLTPAKSIRVKVLSGKETVAKAHVQVDISGFKCLGTTNIDGICELKIPQKESVFLINAWTDDHQVGGIHAGRQPTRDMFGNDFQVDVSHDEPLRVRVVNAEQQAVKDVPITFTAVTGAHGEMFVGDNFAVSQTTNAKGEIEFAWVPNWQDKRIYFHVAENSGWRRLGDGAQKKLSNGSYQLNVAKLKERVRFAGQLSGVTTDVTGLLVEFWGSPGEEESTSDVIYARTDAQGRFVARVLPGSRYEVFVNDSQFVSHTWDDVISHSLENTVNPPQLTLSKGVPVEVHLTQGIDQKPLENAWLHLETLHKSDRARSIWGRTDERGKFTAVAAPRELRVRVDDGDWQLNQTFQIVTDTPSKIHLHRQYTQKRPLTGKLSLPAGTTADLSKMTIKIAGMDGEYRDTTTVTADAQGNFKAAIIAGRVSLLATSLDEEFFGCGIVDLRENLIEIPIHPTVAYGGQVLDAEDRPESGLSVRMSARLKDRQREYSAGTPDFQKQFVELFDDRTVKTDVKGYFVFPKTPQRIELSISIERPGDDDSVAFQKTYLEPGEERAPERIRAGRSSKPASSVRKPLASAIAEAVRNSRLAAIHALVIVTGAGESVSSFVELNLSNKTESTDFYSYLPRQIDGPEAAALADHQEYFKAQKWPFPEPQTLFLVALDGNGKELGRLTLNLRSDQAIAKDFAAFLKDHLPPRHDAKAEYAVALAEAKRTNRRLWARVGGTRCGPCYSFSRWLDSQNELLTKDYVMFKFDGARDLNGPDLSSALKFDGHGIPCHAILDANGNELINSIGPLGNIGTPVGDVEGTIHLKKMLKSTAQKLTDDEIELLIRSIPKE